MVYTRLAFTVLAAGAAAAGLGAPASASARGRPRAPTQLAGSAGLQVRPYVISYTGDGTAYLGGFTGRRSVPHAHTHPNLHWAGRLHWSDWTSSHADATGADWGNDGIPSDGSGTFHPAAATVRLFRARAGVFTRMTVHTVFGGRPSTLTYAAVHEPASLGVPSSWYWQPAG